jgi:beta-lactamase regulating signal transducer with metallopeptidase domain
MATLLNSVLLNAAVAATMAIVVWMIATIPCIRRRPGLRHCLWVVVLLKLVTPPMFELSILPHWFAAEPEPIAHPRAMPLDELSFASLLDTNSIVASPSVSASGPSFDGLLVLVVTAALGSLGVLARATAEVWRLRRALRHGAANDARLIRISAEAAKSMGVASPPPACVVTASVSPLLWVRRSGPLIVVPRRLSDELTDEQLGCVVAHEIAHYLRRDHWTNLLSLLVAAVCWWNPVVWWARRELRIAQEACCDALVISRSVASRRKYAETLFQALEFLQAERSLLPALASGFGNKSWTERRFEMIANPLVNHRLSWWSYPVVLAALAVLPCLPGFTQAQDQAGRSQEVVVDYGLVPVEIKDLDGDPLDDHSFCVEIKDLDGDPLDAQDQRVTFVFNDRYSREVVVKYSGQTDRRVYRYHRSKLGVVVLAFELESGKLAWSSEIELPAGANAVSSRRFLLHTGGGVVTVAVLKDEDSLTIQELDAESGKVTAECRLNRPAKDRSSKSDVERKKTEETLKALKDQLQSLIDEQLKQVGERALRGEGDRASEQESSDFWRQQEGDFFWQLREAKEIGDALIIATDGRLTIETAGSVWRLINGDAPIQSVRMVCEDGKDRMIIEGKAAKHRRIILEIRTDGDKAGSADGELRPDGASDGEEKGASTVPTATDPLVRFGVEYLSREKAGAPVSGFQYSPQDASSDTPPSKR